MCPWFKNFKGPLAIPAGLEWFCVMFCFVDFNDHSYFKLYLSLLFIKLHF